MIIMIEDTAPFFMEHNRAGASDSLWSPVFVEMLYIWDNFQMVKASSGIEIMRIRYQETGISLFDTSLFTAEQIRTLILSKLVYFDHAVHYSRILLLKIKRHISFLKYWKQALSLFIYGMWQAINTTFLLNNFVKYLVQYCY